MNCAILKSRCELRPLPGSRVQPIPTHTQGAGVPVSGSPVKGKAAQKRRIQYPPRVCNPLKAEEL